MNVPTVTAAAQLRGQLYLVLEELKLDLAQQDYKKKKPVTWKRITKTFKKKSANKPDFESPWGSVFPHYAETSENLSHVDKMMDFEVRCLLEQVMDLDFNCWSTQEKDDYLQLRLL